MNCLKLINSLLLKLLSCFVLKLLSLSIKNNVISNAVKQNKFGIVGFKSLCFIEKVLTKSIPHLRSTPFNEDHYQPNYHAKVIS